MTLTIFLGAKAEPMAKPLGVSNIIANNGDGSVDQPFSNLRSLFVMPNTYYDIPKHRYPYYDENGRGRLLYGYGGKKLYKYSVFRPIEGYFR